MIFSCESRDPQNIAFMNHISQDVRTPISQFTMPLYGFLNGVGWLCATGVLLRVRDKHFLLSAAHIFDRHHWNGGSPNICVTDGVVGNPIFPIGEATLRKSPTDDPDRRLETDPFDLCVIDLPKETAERIAAGGKFRYLSLAEVDPWSEHDTRDYFTAAGFPGEDNILEVAPGVLGSKLFCCATFIYLVKRGPIPWRKMDNGVAIPLDYGQLTMFDDHGRPAVPPHPTGMSGGGFWRIGKYSSSTEDWSLKDVKLIGIQSAVYEKQFVLKGTRIEHHLSCIYRGHPDLQEVFDRQYGRDECRKRFEGGLCLQD